MKKRVPMQVAPEFLQELRKIKAEMLLQGKNVSLRDISLELAKSGQLSMGKLKQEIRLRFDERKTFL